MTEYIKELVDMFYDDTKDSSLSGYLYRLEVDDIKNLILASLKLACRAFDVPCVDFETAVSLPSAFNEPLWKEFVVARAQVDAFQKYTQLVIDETSYKRDALGVDNSAFYRAQRCKELEEIGQENCDPHEWEICHSLYPWEKGFMWPGESEVRKRKDRLAYKLWHRLALKALEDRTIT